MPLPSKANFGFHCEYERRRIPKKDCVAAPDDQTRICGDVRSSREPSISTRRATLVGGVKSGVCGLCEGVGPAAQVPRSWRLGAARLDQARNVGGRRKKRRLWCL